MVKSWFWPGAATRRRWRPPGARAAARPFGPGTAGQTGRERPSEAGGGANGQKCGRGPVRRREGDGPPPRPPAWAPARKKKSNFKILTKWSKAGRGPCGARRSNPAGEKTVTGQINPQLVKRAETARARRKWRRGPPAGAAPGRPKREPNTDPGRPNWSKAALAQTVRTGLGPNGQNWQRAKW